MVGLYAGVPALVLYALLGSIGQVPKLKHHPLIPNRNVRSLPEATVAAVVIAAVIELVAIGGR